MHSAARDWQVLLRFVDDVAGLRNAFKRPWLSSGKFCNESLLLEDIHNNTGLCQSCKLAKQTFCKVCRWSAEEWNMNLEFQFVNSVMFVK